MAGVPAARAAETPDRVEPSPVAVYDSASGAGDLLSDLSAGFLRPDGSIATLNNEYAVDGGEETTSLVTIGEPLPWSQIRRLPLSRPIIPAPGAFASPRTAAVSGVGGYDWTFDVPETRPARPGEDGDVTGSFRPTPALVGIDDRGRSARRVALRAETNPTTSERVSPQVLVATGAGLRAIVALQGRVELRRADGHRLSRLERLVSVEAAVGRPDGSVLLSGSGSRDAPDWNQAIVRVDARGDVQRVRRRGTRQVVTGEPIANVLGGTLIATQRNRRMPLALLADDGRVRGARPDWKALPWSAECLRRKNAFRVSWAMPGPTGRPVLGVECVRSALSVEEVVQAFTVGLDAQLGLRWYSAAAGRATVGADGRLYVGAFSRAEAQYRLDSLAEPGAPGPRRGKVVSVRRQAGGAVVTIACRSIEGTVCSGTVRIAGDRGASASLPYALRGRPGAAGATIRRTFSKVPKGQLRASLGR